MAPQLNHTIVWCRNQEASAAFLAEILGLPAPARWGPFHVVELANGVNLDFHEATWDIAPQHYAFLIGEDEFDRIHGLITERRIAHWADPARSRPGTINRNDGGRGVYFSDPDGHLMEVITRPYGSGGA